MKLNSKKLKNIIIKSSFLLFFLVIIFLPLFSNAADYKLLEPIPGSTDSISTSAGDVSEYIKTIYNYLLGLAVALSVLMLVIGGVEYTTSFASESQAGNAKKRITDAITGLLIALLSFVVLNTVSPKLVIMDLPDAGSCDPGIGIDAYGNAVYSGSPDGTTNIQGGEASRSPQQYRPGIVPSNGIKTLPHDLTAENTEVTIDKGDKTIIIKKNGVEIARSNINIGIGDRDGTKIGGINGDKITPVGEFTVTEDMRYNSRGVSTNDGTSLGTAFIGLSAKDENGNYRGIGIHGPNSANDDGTLRNTYGCVRVTNQEAENLFNALKPGTKVVITN